MNPRSELSIIVLAAGRSTRAGHENKLLLPCDNKPMIQAVVESMVDVPHLEILVAVGHDRDHVQTALRDQPVRFVFNPEFEAGMSFSIRAGVAATNNESSGYMIALGDMPRVRHESLLRLSDAFHQHGPETIVVPVTEERRGHPVIFGRHFRGELLKLRGDRGAKAVITRNPNAIVQVQVDDPGIFLDVDTPHGLTSLE